MALLEVCDLKIHFPIKGSILGRRTDHIKAVDGVTFSIESGQALGLVGESGSGKSSIGRAIVGLNQITSGTIRFKGEDITPFIRKNRSPYRRGIQMIFQNPYSSFNPRRRVLDIIAEPLRNFEKLTPTEERKEIERLLNIVGLSADVALKYPHELSGGQRQRIGIARAIALKPALIVADEPVSALDLSVQAQVLNYMKNIQNKYNMAFLLISHDLSVVWHMCTDLVIMHKGRFVEKGSRADIYNEPTHIYTQKLIAAIPDIDPDAREKRQFLRQKLNREHERFQGTHYDTQGQVFDLRKVNGSSSHFVALKG